MQDTFRSAESCHDFIRFEGDTGLIRIFFCYGLLEGKLADIRSVVGVICGNRILCGFFDGFRCFEIRFPHRQHQRVIELGG
ncbi:hypothetical protein SDC9_146605 [bioreactor metagenome]|uniref:Uncharacterized protein n=1 Tax=bioreactor metagenome TaxID=1076179 RepID=A0A645EBJ1_9ZZZZ